MIQTDLGSEQNWKSFFRLAGICAMLIVVMGLTDVVLSSTAGEVTVNSLVPAKEWFEMFRSQPVSAFSNLGMINVINLTLQIPIFIALVYAQRKLCPAFGLLAGILFLVGLVIYFASNTVLPMYGLSKEYFLAADAEKPLIEAAGRALLARGADLGLGTFPGFLLSQSAGLLMGLILLKTKFLGKVAPWIAIAGYCFMLAFFIISAFDPANFSFAMILSAPGGLLLMAFQVMIALKFFKLSR